MISDVSDRLTKRQRWSFYLTYIFAGVAFFIGVNLRDSILYATTLYVNSQAGIEAEYPQNWLLDTAGDYVFRVRDSAKQGFKTTIQVTLRPVNVQTTAERNILDALTLSRSQTLADYTVQSIEEYVLPNESVVTRMNYTYVATETNPFLENVPVVVQGVDLLTSRRGQVIVITFQTALPIFEEEFPVFERFLRGFQF